MQLADEIIGQHGVSNTNSVESGTTGVAESRMDSFSKLPAVQEEMPEISDGQRNIFLEGAGVEVTESQQVVKESKRKPTKQEIQILMQAAKILRETTFAGSLGTNMAGASTFVVNPKKKKKKKRRSLTTMLGETHVVQGQPPSEFGRTFGNAWAPYSNSIAGKPQALDSLAKGILKKFKKKKRGKK